VKKRASSFAGRSGDNSLRRLHRRAHRRGAEAGATKEEIAEALGVAVGMNAGAALVYSTRVLDAVEAKSGKSTAANQFLHSRMCACRAQHGCALAAHAAQSFQLKLNTDH